MTVKYVGSYYKLVLIKGKSYEVIKTEGTDYVIKDEEGDVSVFPAAEFEIVA